MNKLTLTGLLLLALGGVGCDKSGRATVDGKIKGLWASVSDSDFIRTRGIGATRTDIKGKTQRMALSREAALVQARYEMLVIIKGAHMEGGVTVELAMEKDSNIKALVDRLIRGAEEVKTEWLEDDGCVVTIELKRAQVEKMLKDDEKWEKAKWERDERKAELERPRSATETDLWYGKGDREVYAAEPSRRADRRLAPGEKSPLLAGVVGTFIPGGALIYAGGDNAKLGWGALATVIVLASAGSAKAKPEGGKPPPKDGSASNGQALCLGSAAVVHFMALYYGVKATKQGGYAFAAKPILNEKGVDGGEVTVAYRW